MFPPAPRESNQIPAAAWIRKCRRCLAIDRRLQAQCNPRRIRRRRARTLDNRCVDLCAAALERMKRDSGEGDRWHVADTPLDRKSTRLNSSHLGISYAVFCLKKKT